MIHYQKKMDFSGHTVVIYCNHPNYDELRSKRSDVIGCDKNCSQCEHSIVAIPTKDFLRLLPHEST